MLPSRAGTSEYVPYEQKRGSSFLVCHFGGESSATNAAEAVQNFRVAQRGKAPNATSRVRSS